MAGLAGMLVTSLYFHTIKPRHRLDIKADSAGKLTPTAPSAFLLIDNFNMFVARRRVNRGQQLAVMEAMKMEHVIAADCSGVIRRITMSVGDVIREGYPLFFIEASGCKPTHIATPSTRIIRPDSPRRNGTLHAGRDRQRRRPAPQNDARENIADRDPDTFIVNPWRRQPA